MSTSSESELLTLRTPAASLAKVLQQCQDAKAMVMESVRDLLAVNAAFEQTLESWGAMAAGEHILRTSKAVQVNMRSATERLSAAIKGLERETRARDLLEHQFAAAVEQEAGARRAALHDALTGVPNRALFDDRLEHGVAQAKRHGWTMALMFVDLDDFKQINDRYGHDVGDRVLRTIAQRLKDNTRSDDTVSRHGGDEFLYLAVDIGDEASASLIAANLIDAIQAPFNVIGEDLATRLSVKASIGISIFPRHGTDSELLVKSADRAMYRAKQTKSGYSFAD